MYPWPTLTITPREDVFDIAERSDEGERPPPTDLNGFNITNNDDKLWDDVTRSRHLPSSGGRGGNTICTRTRPANDFSQS